MAIRSRRRWPAWTAVAVTGLALVLSWTTIVADRRLAQAVPKLPTLGREVDVYDGDIGDPFVLPITAGPSGQTGFVMFGTNDQPTHTPTALSRDLRVWWAGADAVPELPRWASPDPEASLTWAPAVLTIHGHYILYVSVQEAASQRECVAALSSPVAEGPYRDALGAPIVCQRALGGSIDPTVVRDGRGDLHLAWKSDGNCCALPVSIWQQRLTADGLGLTGAATRMLTASQPWQGGIIEEPALTPAAGHGWWLWYSGNQFDSTLYSEGLAFCPTLEGPCRETRRTPFLTSHGRQFSPGGVETFRDASGARWIVYDVWNRPPRDGRYYCCRSVYLAPLLSS